MFKCIQRQARVRSSAFATDFPQLNWLPENFLQDKKNSNIVARIIIKITSSSCNGDWGSRVFPEMCLSVSISF